MKRYLVAALLFAALPIGAYAATQAELQAQIQALLAQLSILQEQLKAVQQQTPQTGNAAASSEICSLGNVTLREGSRGAAVSVLQRFLKERGYFTATVTDFFGPLTARALAQFQLDARIVLAIADGGVYGPRTRQYVAERYCKLSSATSQPLAAPPACLNPLRPTLSCDGAWQMFRDGSGCHTGWTCVVTQAAQASTTAPVNKAPLISAIVGPTLRKPSESGTWAITASDPEGDALVYSVVWGDEGPSVATLLNISQEGTPYATSTSVSHTYTQTGSYTLVVFAKDAAGNIVKATLSLVVYEPPPPPPPPVAVAPATQGAGNSSSKGVFACYLNGQGFSVETPPANCTQYGGAADARTPPEECKKYLSGDLRCTSAGWSGSTVYMSGYKVGCTSSKGVFIPGGVTVYGGGLCNGQTCKTGETNVQQDYYKCRNDGWWSIDTYGNFINMLSLPPENISGYDDPLGFFRSI